MSESELSKKAAELNFDVDPPKPQSAPREPEPPEEVTLETLKQQHDGLRRLLIVALLVMLVFSASFNLALMRQVGSTRKDVENIRPQIERLQAQQQQQAPAVQTFIENLRAFARSHPDFNQVLNRYNLGTPEPATQLIPGEDLESTN
jgi:hypothetical protein